MRYDIFCSNRGTLWIWQIRAGLNFDLHIIAVGQRWRWSHFSSLWHSLALIAFFRSFELLLGRWWVLGPSSIFRVSYTNGCWIANGWHGACGRQAWSLGNISFFSLTSTRSLLKHKFYAHYTVNSLSVPLCSVNTNTKSCFSFRQFWRQIQKEI